MKTLALLGLALVLFHFGAPAHPVADADPKSAFAEFDRLLPLAKSDADAEVAKVRTALAEGKSAWLTIAAVEAVRQAEVDVPSKGKRFLPEVLALLDEKQQKLHEQQIVTVNVLACLGVLVAKGDPEVSDVVKAIVGWQRWSKNTTARLRDMADRVLLKLSGEDCTLKEETLAFWDWWLAQQAAPGGNRPPAQSRTAPVIFKEPMVGTRIVFVIDVSDSMKYPISKPDIPKMRERAPDLPWDKENKPTAMWVAAEELARSIDALRPAKNPVAPRNARSTKTEPEPRHFAIVTYSNDSKLITPGWVEATKDNCDSWMKKARALETETTTNIHAGLLQAFGISARSNASANPELDADCVLTGAHTIMFLTDGYATWSNDSKSRTERDEFGNPTGDGQYVKRDKLAELARHINRFRKVVINTVGIGIHDKALMAAFAKDSGGAYTDWGCNIDWK